MKIFYAVQATGNGHIARAKEIIPFLQKYGKVDVFLSGANSSLQPGFDVAYRSKGLCFFYNKFGGIDYLKTLRHVQLSRVLKEAKSLPLKQYDLVINDFECITSLAAKMQKVTTVGVGHQVSFQSPHTPRPLKSDWAGELVLRKYATATFNIGFHFKRYDSFIYPPIVKAQIKDATSKYLGHITVYLPQYGDLVIFDELSKYSNYKFQVFSPFVKKAYEQENVQFFPIENNLFTRSVINANAVITGAGFETPAEVLYLRKNLVCIPIKGQYEQLCNAKSLEEFGAIILSDLSQMSEPLLSRIMEDQLICQPMEAFDNSALVEKILSYTSHNVGNEYTDFIFTHPLLFPISNHLKLS